MNKDLRKEWGRYTDDEFEKAEDRAGGDTDPDYAVQTFGAYLESRYRGRIKPGILMFSIGFAPLGAGLYTGLTLGEGSEVMLGLAGVGAAVIVAGAVLWGVRGVQLKRFREARAALDLSTRPRVIWRGLGPMYVPGIRAHGVSLGFAF